MSAPQDTNQLRFMGIEQLYGKGAVEKLQKSHVTIIGLGGVGSWVVESLARSGVGHLRLIELDDICLSNTNRQIHTLEETIGHSKIDVMSERAKSISPNIKIEKVEDFITDTNTSSVMKKTDLVIDAIDSVYPKAALINHCIVNEQEIITTGASGGKRDPAALDHGDLGESRGDALLHKLKKILKKKYAYPKGEYIFNVSAVYSPERVYFLDEQGNLRRSEANAHTQLDCQSGLGSASYVTGSFGLMASSLAVKKLLALKNHAL